MPDQGVNSGRQTGSQIFKGRYVGTSNTSYIDTTFGELGAMLANNLIVEFMTNIRTKANTTVPAGSVLCTFTSGQINADVPINFPVICLDSDTSTYHIVMCYIGNTGQIRTREKLNSNATGYVTLYFNGICFNIARKYYLGNL